MPKKPPRSGPAQPEPSASPETGESAVATDLLSPLAAPKPYRVLVADDHAVVRHGLRLLLESQPGIEVCWEASNGVEVIELVKRERPDMIVLDLTMPEMNGLEAVREVREISPDTAVLVLTMHFSEELAREVLRCGALAYVLKSDADGDLLTAVDHVRNNQPYFTTRLTLSMAQSYVRRPGDPPGEDQGSPPLTAREMEVVQLLAEGKSNKEVASTLGVSTRTVESHRNHIMRRMSFASFSDLVRYAIRNNLIEP
jgi:DNA-binding NarL/FixJ family response regulator